MPRPSSLAGRAALIDVAFSEHDDRFTKVAALYHIEKCLLGVLKAVDNPFLISELAACNPGDEILLEIGFVLLPKLRVKEPTI